MERQKKTESYEKNQKHDWLFLELQKCLIIRIVHLNLQRKIKRNYDKQFSDSK